MWPHGYPSASSACLADTTWPQYYPPASQSWDEDSLASLLSAFAQELQAEVARTQAAARMSPAQHPVALAELTELLQRKVKMEKQKEDLQRRVMDVMAALRKAHALPETFSLGNSPALASSAFVDSQGLWAQAPPEAARSKGRMAPLPPGLVSAGAPSRPTTQSWQTPMRATGHVQSGHESRQQRKQIRHSGRSADASASETQPSQSQQRRAAAQSRPAAQPYTPIAVDLPPTSQIKKPVTAVNRSSDLGGSSRRPKAASPSASVSALPPGTAKKGAAPAATFVPASSSVTKAAALVAPAAPVSRGGSRAAPGGLAAKIAPGPLGSAPAELDDPWQLAMPCGNNSRNCRVISVDTSSLIFVLDESDLTHDFSLDGLPASTRRGELAGGGDGARHHEASKVKEFDIAAGSLDPGLMQVLMADCV